MTMAQFQEQKRNRDGLLRAQTRIRKADAALKRALIEAFPGQHVDQNRLDAVTSVLTAMGHDVKAVRRG